MFELYQLLSILPFLIPCYHLKYHSLGKDKPNNKKQIYYQCLLINIIVAFSDSFANEYNDIDSEFFDNHIIILKRVKSLRWLRRTEKELVRLNYKKAVINGFTMKGIQQYIASKSKI